MQAIPIAVGAAAMATLLGCEPAETSWPPFEPASLYDASGQSLSFAEDRLYIGNYWGALHAVDVSNPSQPAILGTLYMRPDEDGMENGLFDVAASDKLVYLANYDSMLLEIVDASDPANMTFISEVAMPYAKHIAVADGLAFVACLRFHGEYSSDTGWEIQDTVVMIVDVHDPRQPAVVGEVVLPSQANDIIAVADGIVLAACDDGLHIIDASNPSTATLIASLAMPDAPVGLDVQGDFAFVSFAARRGEPGLRVVDVSNAAAPVIVSEAMLLEDGEIGEGAVAVEGDVCALCDGAQLFIIDIANPEQPRVRSMKTDLSPPIARIYGGSDLTMADGVIYMVSEYAGLDVLHAASMVDDE